MEAATLTNPQRKSFVAPVQKSLSLPSYAKAGGEGIDHKVIFAALEQKEKVRRKSKIFTKEKSTRHNLFCLPLPSNTKCKETSLSSDTSCSSLEYQKPKYKKEESLNFDAEHKVEIRTIFSEKFASNSKKATTQNASKTRTPDRSLLSSLSIPKLNSQVCLDKMRLTVGSSDSIDRSSRSSTDSISRKERLTAIKARVEAERLTYGHDSSSEDESQTAIPRYNSDEAIHRSNNVVHRNYRSKSSRSERRLRRRSQDEVALKKMSRKHNVSRFMSSEDDENSMQLNKPIHDTNIYTKIDTTSNFAGVTKKHYCGLLGKEVYDRIVKVENGVRNVQNRIKEIENEERKHRNVPGLCEKMKTTSVQSVLRTKQASPSLKELSIHCDSDVVCSNVQNTNSKRRDSSGRNSPVFRSVHAPPTPPPRSPKSMIFVNKAFMQHQNSLLNPEKRSEINIASKPTNSSVSASNNKFFLREQENRYSPILHNGSLEKRKEREIKVTRRKTCGNFDFFESTLNDLNAVLSIPDLTKRFQMKNSNSSSDTVNLSSNNNEKEISPNKSGKNKWLENEQRREFMFNSLESRKDSNSRFKPKRPSIKNSSCLCKWFPENKLSCCCKIEDPINSNKTSLANVYSNIESTKLTLPPTEYNEKRLSKSDGNIKLHQTWAENDLTINMADDITTAKSNIGTNMNNESTSPNLDSAVAELENVFLSLKRRCDQLQDHIDSSTATPVGFNLKQKDSHKISNANSNHSQHFLLNGKENSSSFINIFQPISKSCSDTSSVFDYPLGLELPSCQNQNDTADLNSPSIDDLFDDLAHQLDIEQKLLNASSFEKSYPLTDFPQITQTVVHDQQLPKHSQVHAKKEFYDNLNKDKSAGFILDKPDKCPKSLSNVQITNNKQKYEAAKSLSDNISALMSVTAKLNPELSHNLKSTNTNLVESTKSHVSNRYDNVPCTKSTTNIIKNNCSSPFRPNFLNLTPNVRNRRVSSDSEPLAFKISSRESISMHRPFSSAFCSPQLSPTSDISKNPLQELPLLQKSEDKTSSCSSRGFGSPQLSPNCDKSFTQRSVEVSVKNSGNNTFNSEKLDTNDAVAGLEQSVSLCKPMVKNINSYPRPFCSPRISPTNEAPKPFAQKYFQSAAQDVSGSWQLRKSVAQDVLDSSRFKCPATQEEINSLKFKQSIDVLDEAALENLLNSLLCEVPDKKQTRMSRGGSLNPNGTPTPPPVPPGEMSMMQHLDVLRVKL